MIQEQYECLAAEAEEFFAHAHSDRAEAKEFQKASLSTLGQGLMPAPPGWYPKRGEVYLVQLDKPQPVIVLSVDPLNKFALDVCVVAVTSVEHGKFSMRVPIKKGDANLNFDCWAKCDQVTTLEKGLLRYPPIGVLSTPALSRIEKQVRVALGLI